MNHITSLKTRVYLSCLLAILVAASPYLLFAQTASPSVTTGQINDAIERGLQYLHQTMTQADTNTGYWSAPYPEATTATAVLAFEVQGHLPKGSRLTDPYVDTVKRGLNYLFTTLRKEAIAPQPAGNPDSNGNGYGLYVAVSNGEVTIYTTGIVLMALAASGTPDAKATVGGDGVQGRAYREIVQDVVDYLAWAQTDPPDAVRGGWRYLPNQGDSDMSVTQWPVLGIEAAIANMKTTVPEWVRTELRDGFLTYAQGSDGGFGYTGPGAGNIARTGAGLVGLAFVGVPAEDERVRRAVDFIGQNWESDNLGNFYAMYGVMKGSKLTEPEITQYNGHNWYAKYADYLVAQQSPDGSWTEMRYASENVPLATGWALLILSPTVFTAFRLPRLPVWPFVVVPLIVLSGLGFWLWRRTRPPARSRPGRPELKPTRPVAPGWPSEKKRHEGGADVTHGRPTKRPEKRR